ncbi:MAG: thiamine-phosphate kinase [Methanospirillum sp.]|uniref:thiamine-phosphate kinase n=1 Tax=Methanospirillum sp. TaxID=45200 RepID=UPI0023740442|nr:thiamine-phosphate kinase [Methanospirillum sp.]MDD1728445.1 thiamine-phosphate kinase [Methanospirillum sp.]
MDDRELLSIICPVLGIETCADDCAVLPRITGIPVVSTDMLHESTDFPQGMTEWQIGWMAMAVTISDLAAMGATPRFLTLAIGLDREERLDELVRGAQQCCLQYGARYIGGDLDAHVELTLVSTGIGSVEDGNPVRRSGTQPGDLIGVTGIHGRAMAGLKGDPRYWKDLCEPKPRVSEGILLRQAGATAMMDISDGLAISIHDLMNASGTGCRIDSSKIPCITDRSPEEALSLALYGGGDFELLFTVPADMKEKIPSPVQIIGEVTRELDILLDGTLLQKKGYVHQW